MGKIAEFFTLEEFAAASRAPLTAEEAEAAKWWASGVLHAIRRQFGPVRISSFIRPVEISGPRKGEPETGAHGRRSTVPGNAVDIVVPGARSYRDVAHFVGRTYRVGRGGDLFAAFDEGNHLHLTRAAHGTASPGVWRGVQRADGSIGPAKWGDGTGGETLQGGGAPGLGAPAPAAPAGGGNAPPAAPGGGAEAEAGGGAGAVVAGVVAVAAFGAWWVWGRS